MARPANDDITLITWSIVFTIRADSGKKEEQLGANWSISLIGRGRKPAASDSISSLFHPQQLLK
jgi:hypothetical protein